MIATESVFERVEKKYRLDARQYRYMMDAVRGHLVPTEFGASTVESTYFDTPDFSLIERSLDKPLYKEKLRVRRYVPIDGSTASDEVFVELKKKCKGVVYKRRIAMSDAAATAYLSGDSYEHAMMEYPSLEAEDGACAFDARTRQIAAEIDAFLRRYRDLRPMILISCDREAFAMPPDAQGTVIGEDELRVTFDARLSYRNLDTPCLDNAASREDTVCPLIGRDEVIMEVKSAGPYPFWLVDALSGCEAYPSSFSKYGTAYGMRILAYRDAKKVAHAARKGSFASSGEACRRGTVGDKRAMRRNPRGLDRRIAACAHARRDEERVIQHA